MGFYNDAAGAAGKTGGKVFDAAWLADLAAYILAGNGLTYRKGKPHKSGAVRDDTMVGTHADGDDLRLALIGLWLASGAMVKPDGLTDGGAVFDGDNDDVPDGFDGLTVKSTTHYDRNDGRPDNGRDYGIWVGIPNQNAGKVKVPAPNGNGGNGQTTDV